MLLNCPSVMRVLTLSPQRQYVWCTFCMHLNIVLSVWLTMGSAVPNQMFCDIVIMKGIFLMNIMLAHNVIDWYLSMMVLGSGVYLLLILWGGRRTVFPLRDPTSGPKYLLIITSQSDNVVIYLQLGTKMPREAAHGASLVGRVKRGASGVLARLEGGI